MNDYVLITWIRYLDRVFHITSTVDINQVYPL